MRNHCSSDGVVVDGNIVYIDGKALPECPAKGRSVTVVNGKVFIDGYEFKKGRWRKTLRALFHKYF